jgi:hypothetical protein
MAVANARLGKLQANGAIGTYGTIYGPVAAGASVVASTLFVCNKSTSPQTFRIAIATDTTPDADEFIYYDETVPAKSTVPLTQGICLDATNKYLMGSASSSDVIFTLCGALIS